MRLIEIMKNIGTTKKALARPLALGITALFAMGAAQAADHNWSGFYAGATVGAVSLKTDTADWWCNEACDAPGNIEQALNGGLSGGYNWQLSDNFVVGIEADISSGAKSSERINSNSTGTQYSEWKNEWSNLSTVRGRAGLAVDRTMVFVTGGLAVAKAKYHAETTWNDSASWSGNLTGLAMGMGMEHALTKNMSFKAEYLRVSMPKKDACWADSTTGECWTAAPYNADNVHWTSSADMFRVGVNWKF